MSRFAGGHHGHYHHAQHHSGAHKPGLGANGGPAAHHHHHKRVKYKDKVKLLSRTQIRQFRAVFNMFMRKEGGSALTIQSIEKIMNTLQQYPTATEIKEMIRHVDKDGSGEIEFLEFLKVMVSRDLDTHEYVKSAFEFFDVSQDGMITPDEIQTAFKRFGNELTIDECTCMCEEITGKKKFDHEDFTKLMKLQLMIITDEDIDDQFEDELFNEVDDEDNEDDSDSDSN